VHYFNRDRRYGNGARGSGIVVMVQGPGARGSYGSGTRVPMGYESVVNMYDINLFLIFSYIALQ